MTPRIEAYPVEHPELAVPFKDHTSATEELKEKCRNAVPPIVLGAIVLACHEQVQQYPVSENNPSLLRNSVIF